LDLDDQPTGVSLALTLLLVPVALVDNVLKPILMARGLTTPMLVILTGVIGGTLTHGLVGLFIGPVVLSVFYELIVAWTRLEDVPAEVPSPTPGGHEARWSRYTKAARPAPPRAAAASPMPTPATTTRCRIPGSGPAAPSCCTPSTPPAWSTRRS
jgi:AI-2E family transporter